MVSEPLPLAEQLLESTQALITHLRSNPAAPLSALRTSPASLAAVSAQNALTTALTDPAKAVFTLVATQWDLMALSFALEFNVFPHLTPEGIHISELSNKINVDPQRIGRMLRLLSTRNIVAEKGDGVFASTETSERICADQAIRDCFAFLMDEVYQATVTNDAFLKERPGPEDTTQESVFGWKWGKEMYEYYAEDEEKGRRFASGQEGVSKLETQDTLLHEWAKGFKTSTGTIVDVGGGKGHIVMELAELLPEYTFIVQDLYTTMFNTDNIPTPLRPRITFQQHDFFTPQPIAKDVSAYILRRCLHNWPDSKAVQILRGFVPTLKSNPDARLLINESVMPDTGEGMPKQEYLWLSQLDLAMMVLLNARQRTEEDWRQLVEEASSELEVVGVKTELGGVMGLIEVKAKADEQLERRA